MADARPPATDDFHAFEHEAWEHVAIPYRDAFSSLTAQSLGALLDAVAARPKCEGMGIVHRAIEAYGRLDVPLPEGPPFFRFGDHDECRRVLAASGFSGVEVRELPLRWRLPTPDALLDAFLEGGVRTRGLLRAQTPEALAVIRRAVRDEASRHAGGGGVEFAMPAVLASGVKA